LEASIETMPVQSITVEQDPEKAVRWYCPRCGQPMAAVDGNTLEKVCGNCGFRLTGWIVYQLVEKHPHKKGGKWY